ncbi:MAG: DUF3823 domain-containing protein [Bacteroidales bacterium]
MKKIDLYMMLVVLILCSSCSMFELDNYDEPTETIKGTITDVLTGKPILTDQGGEGIRVRMLELSWGDNVGYNPDIYCKSDGTYQNTKVFKGEYNVQVDGPFIPLYRTDENGTPLHDGTWTGEISGVTEVNFKVQPFLNIEWVGDPIVSNGRIKTKIKVTRGVSNEDFRAAIESMGNWDDSWQNVTDIQLFVSLSPSVGYRARDVRWTGQIEFDGSSFEEFLDKEVEISSEGSIPDGYVVFIRAAARINYETVNQRRYNYNEAKQVLIAN